MADNKMKITPTSISNIVEMSKGEVVEIPGFKSDEPVYFRLTRPSILLLAKTGRIPNALMSRASELFSKGSRSFGEDDGNMLAESYDVLHSLAEAAMVEPTMADLENAGVTLTDDQLIAIFNYTQNGINALTSFREKQGSSQPSLSLA